MGESKEKNEGLGLKKGIIEMLQDTMKCNIFVLDLTTKMWGIKRNKNIGDDKLAVPSKLIGSSRIIRVGEFLVQLAGGFRGSNINNLYLLKIPTSIWNRERLIWIGHYKENDKDKSD